MTGYARNANRFWTLIVYRNVVRVGKLWRNPNGDMSAKLATTQSTYLVDPWSTSGEVCICFNQQDFSARLDHR